MSARQSMTMRALVERDTASGTDAYGLPVKPVFTVLATLPCRVWSVADRDISDGDKVTVIEGFKAIFPRGADVVEGDEISAINDRLGVEVFAGRFRIDTMQKRADHQVASMEVVGCQ